VVQSGGVAIAIPVAMIAARIVFAARVRVSLLATPISIIETPIALRTSTRSKSVQGDHGWPSTNSCTRNSNPKPKISAPRRIVVSAISFAETPFARMRSVTSANETPTRKRNSGAGSVPPSCDHPMNADLRAAPPSHES
jgi:hypothetical protein